MKTKRKKLSHFKIRVLRISKGLQNFSDKLSIPIGIVGMIIFIKYYSVSLSIAEKSIGVIGIAVSAIYIIYRSIRLLVDSTAILPVPDHIDKFYDDAFNRIARLNSNQIRFAHEADLVEISKLIQNNPTFIQQFNGDYRPRYELYQKWNTLTDYKAVTQVFSEDGKIRIGASIILPLSKKCFDKLVAADSDTQWHILTNLTDDDIELNNPNETYYLIDILLIDKKAINKLKHTKNQNLRHLYAYLSGISLHSSLWHLSMLNQKRFYHLPNVLIQPDVFGVLKWTHDDAGFIIPGMNQKSAEIGDYIFINASIFKNYEISKDYSRFRIINQCLILLKVYQQENLSLNKFRKS